MEVTHGKNGVRKRSIKLWMKWAKMRNEGLTNAEIAARSKKKDGSSYNADYVSRALMRLREL